MTAYAEALAPVQAPAFDAATTACKQAEADWCAEQARTIAAGGAQAAAAEVWHPGHRHTAEQIQAELEDIHGLRQRAGAA